MKYYLVHIQSNQKKEIESFPSLKEARMFIKRKSRFHKCYKCFYKEPHVTVCDCRTYKVFAISERLLDTKESGNV